MKLPPLILASNSAARASILTAAGFNFTVDPADIDEESFTVTPISQLVQVLAEEKAKVVQKRSENALIIAADTVIVHSEKGMEELIGKPRDDTHAKEILKKLAGNRHEVLTGVCVVEAQSGQYARGYESSLVTFKPLTESEIDNYIKTGEPRGKSGAYALQGIARYLLLEKLEGDENNVRGLPLNLLSKLLNQLGYGSINPLHSDAHLL